MAKLQPETLVFDSRWAGLFSHNSRNKTKFLQELSCDLVVVYRFLNSKFLEKFYVFITA